MGSGRLAVSVESVRPDCSLRDAAHRMIRDAVHVLLVTEGGNDAVLGILTNRDLVRQVAAGVDAGATTVATCMSKPVTTLPETASRSELSAKMRVHGIRHVPLVDESGVVHRIVSLEDLLCEMGQEIADLSAAIQGEFQHEVEQTKRDR